MMVKLCLQVYRFRCDIYIYTYIKKVNSQLLNAGLLYFKSFESASYYESTQMKMNIVAQPVLIHSVFTVVKNVTELTECEALP